ncbi:MAG: serine hydrolase [Chloroflexota bacterium]
MAGTALRTTRRRFHLPVLPLLSGGFLLAALILLSVEVFHFVQRRDSLQSDVVVAGVPVGRLKSADAAAAWESIYTQPIELDYQQNPILLDPAAVGFHVDSDQMLKAMQAKGSGASSPLSDFWNYLWRKPPDSVQIDLAADYQQARLHEYLQNIAARYDQKVSKVNFDTNTLLFAGSTAPQQLDIDASLQAIDSALRRPTDRRVALAMKSQPAAAADISSLKQAITMFLAKQNFSTDGPDTLTSVVVIDLKTGAEVDINPNIAYSAESTIKIPILLNMFRQISAPPSNDIKFLMGASLLCSNNDASNSLMRFAGTGSTLREQLTNGLKGVDDTAQQLGARNTFISAPIDVGDDSLHWSIGAPKTSPDHTFDAKPDPYSQTTALDMATLLYGLYDCSEYKSGVMAAFPDNYTQNECKQMIELLSGNILGHMIELGAPAGTRIAHKNGWGASVGSWNSSDAAIVYTPGGNYVLSIYMWEKLKDGQEVGSIVPWNMIESISRITYNYFNPNQPMTANRTPENALLSLGCVMPNNAHPELIDLNNIKSGRFDAEGHILPDACYDWPKCKPIPASKLSTQGGSDQQTTAQNDSGATPPK